MRPTLVILAAGAGTRFGGPKQLEPIGPSGETLLEYSAFDARRAGFGDVVLVVRSETEPTFRQRLDTTMARHLPLTYVHQNLADSTVDQAGAERRKPWGTGQAVLAARTAIEGPFATVNADDFYGDASYASLFRFLTDTAGTTDLGALGFSVAETLTEAGAVSRGLLSVDCTGHLDTIDELLEVWRDDERIVFRDRGGQRRELSGGELVSMNMWGFKPALLPELQRRFEEFVRTSDDDVEEEFRLPEVIQSLVSTGRFRVRVLTGAGEWCGITYPRDLEWVQSTISSLIERGRYPKQLWT